MVKPLTKTHGREGKHPAHTTVLTVPTVVDDSATICNNTPHCGIFSLGLVDAVISVFFRSCVVNTSECALGLHLLSVYLCTIQRAAVGLCTNNQRTHIQHDNNNDQHFDMLTPVSNTPASNTHKMKASRRHATTLSRCTRCSLHPTTLTQETVIVSLSHAL